MHNLHYVDGSDGGWDDVMPLALIGISRAFKIDLAPYLSDWAKAEFPKIDRDCIGEHSYDHLTFSKLVKPQYADPTTIKPFVDTANKLIMGNNSTPSVPLFIREGTDGASEGTDPDPVYGDGDGVMLVKDVRALTHKYCEAGVAIDYLEVPFGHGNTGAETLVDSIAWLQARFAGVPPVENTCAIVSALPRNSLAPTAITVKATCQGKPATIFGTNEDDVLEGTEGDDVIAGLGGNDTIRGGGGNDRICGDGGNDSLSGGDGNDQISGLAGNDRLFGGAGTDYMNGDDGNDRLSGGSGADRLDGGSGRDIASYAERSAGVGVRIDGEPSSGNSSDGPSGARDRVLTTIEDLLGGTGPDNLIGSGAANTLTGNLGSDKLYGQGGNDTLLAKDGVKDFLIDGGTGTDAVGRDSIDPAPVNVP